MPAGLKLKPGLHSEAVPLLARRLAVTGDYTGTVSESDTAYGPELQEAVKRFQRKHGLRADGAIGAHTWRKLMRVKPDTIDWSHKGSGPGKLSPAGSPAAPRSASLPAVRDEIPPTGRH